MIFWSIVFFTISIYSLIRGGLFKKTFSKINKLQADVIDSGDTKKYLLEWLKAVCFTFITMFSLFIAQAIFLIKAIEYDIYKFPTIVVIALIIIGLVRIKKKNKKIEDMTADELIIHKAELLKPIKRTFLQLLRSILWTTYYGYMFYVLVFLNT